MWIEVCARTILGLAYSTSWKFSASMYYDIMVYLCTMSHYECRTVFDTGGVWDPTPVKTQVPHVHSHETCTCALKHKYSTRAPWNVPGLLLEQTLT